METTSISRVTGAYGPRVQRNGGRGGGRGGFEHALAEQADPGETDGRGDPDGDAEPRHRPAVAAATPTDDAPHVDFFV